VLPFAEIRAVSTLQSLFFPDVRFFSPGRVGGADDGVRVPALGATVQAAWLPGAAWRTLLGMYGTGGRAALPRGTAARCPCVRSDLLVLAA
jgi:hypothetical protein